MSSAEAAEETPKTRRPRPQGMSQGEAAIVDAIDDLREEVRALRAQAPTGRQLILAVLVVAGMFFANQVYLTSGLLATRGVDLGDAADATKKVVGAASDAVPTEPSVTPAEVPGG